MGFDLYGKNPQNETGRYFRNNVWWWRPLWSLVSFYGRDVLTKKDIEAGQYNSGHVITKKKAKELSLILKDFISDPAKNQPVLDKLMDTYKTTTASGTVCEYPIDFDNIKLFIDFLDHCEGFEIW